MRGCSSGRNPASSHTKHRPGSCSVPLDRGTHCSEGLQHPQLVMNNGPCKQQMMLSEPTVVLARLGVLCVQLCTAALAGRKCWCQCCGFHSQASSSVGLFIRRVLPVTLCHRAGVLSTWSALLVTSGVGVVLVPDRKPCSKQRVYDIHTVCALPPCQLSWQLLHTVWARAV